MFRIDASDRGQSKVRQSIDLTKCTQKSSKRAEMSPLHYIRGSLTDPPMKTFGTERWPVMD